MCRVVSSTSWSRRDLLGRGLLALGTAVLALPGCGFTPMYGPAPGGSGEQPAELLAELAAIRVGPIGERYGQIMRRDLQRRLEGTAPGTQARYLLNVGIGLNAEILGYRRDGSISRVRYTATGEWALNTLSVPPQVVARSVLPFRTIDSFNVPDLQFFSADTSREAMERRLAEVVAEEIVREVTLTLRERLAARAAPATARAG